MRIVRGQYYINILILDYYRYHVVHVIYLGELLFGCRSRCDFFSSGHLGRDNRLATGFEAGSTRSRRLTINHYNQIYPSFVAQPNLSTVAITSDLHFTETATAMTTRTSARACYHLS